MQDPIMQQVGIWFSPLVVRARSLTLANPLLDSTAGTVGPGITPGPHEESSSAGQHSEACGGGDYKDPMSGRHECRPANYTVCRHGGAYLSSCLSGNVSSVLDMVEMIAISPPFRNLQCIHSAYRLSTTRNDPPSRQL